VRLFANVARVEAQPGHPGLNGCQCQSVLEVDVGNDRHRRAWDDFGQTLCGLHVVAGDTNDIGTRTRQGVDLGEGGVDIGRLGGGHRLNRYRAVATDRDISDVKEP
jgi:hypothetical protein